MMENIYIRIRKPAETNFYAFTQSATGTLDFAGKVAEPDLSGFEEFSGSHYFSPANFSFLSLGLQAEIHVLYRESSDLQNANLFSFLSHIGAVLLAVEENDSLLVAELLNRRPEVFFQYLPLTLCVVKSVAPLALFAWLYGRFSQNENFLEMYQSGAKYPRSADTAEILFAAAFDALSPEPGKESADEMFIRYLKSHKGMSFTTGIVGENFHEWDSDMALIDRSLREVVGKDLLDETSKAREKKANFISQLAVSVQAEPYNPRDLNAIGVAIENVEGKLYGNGGKSKAGYLRATGAAILRKAFPKKIAYKATLARLGVCTRQKNGISEVILRLFL